MARKTGSSSSSSNNNNKKGKALITTVSSGSSVMVMCDPGTPEAEGRRIKSSSLAWAIQ